MKDMFSASEINKFCYCRLQWYYERKYGAKQLREWRKELNSEMGWEAPKGESHFERGTRFHQEYNRRYRNRQILRWVITVAVLSVFIYFLAEIFLG